MSTPARPAVARHRRDSAPGGSIGNRSRRLDDMDHSTTDVLQELQKLNRKVQEQMQGQEELKEAVRGLQQEVTEVKASFSRERPLVRRRSGAPGRDLCVSIFINGTKVVLMPIGRYIWKPFEVLDKLL